MANVVGVRKVDSLGDFQEKTYDTGVVVLYYLYWPIVVFLPGEGHYGRPHTFSKRTQELLYRYLPEGAVVVDVDDLAMQEMVKGENRGRYRRKLAWGE